MKPRSFEYISATSLSDVFSALGTHGGDAMILAGGQSVMPALNMRLNEPAVLVDINRVPGLAAIEENGGVLRIGALCRHEQVRTSPEVVEHAPLLAKALAHVAHPAIRNRGTFGGSICNADAAAELPACVLALGATLHVESAEGSRAIAAEDFFFDFFETALEEGEVLTSIDLPVLGATGRHFFDEVARRRGDYALAGLAATARVEGGRMIAPRFAFISCGDRPLLAGSLGELVAKRYPDAPAAEEIAEALAHDLEPPEDAVTSAAARMQIATVLAARAIREFQQKGGRA